VHFRFNQDLVSVESIENCWIGKFYDANSNTCCGDNYIDTFQFLKTGCLPILYQETRIQARFLLHFLKRVLNFPEPQYSILDELPQETFLLNKLNTYIQNYAMNSFSFQEAINCHFEVLILALS
tara:strand:- start:6389 stop:6760 length:372 start_codon:yes stop_codon:yes gene_type:complete